MVPLECEIITEEDRLTRIGAHWETLLAELGERGTPFMTPSWYHCWWGHFAAGARLNVVVVREGETVLAICPFMKRRLFMHGLPVRALSFMENGNSLHNDLLVASRRREEVLEGLLAFLEGRGDWDVLQLNNIPVSSPNRDAVARLLEKRRLRHQFRPSFASPFVEVAGEWEPFLAGRPTKVRKAARRVTSGMNQAGEWEVCEVVGWEEFLAEWSGVREVAERSWTHAIGDSLAEPVNASFFRELARAAAAEGRLSLWLLKLNGATVAFEFHVRGARIEYAMRASYDERFAWLSPGTFLEMEIVKRLFQRGGSIRRLDLGGSFDQYKRRWCDHATSHVCLTVFNGRPRGRLAAFHELATVRLGRALRDRARNWRRQR
ncbi:GNAT family N-acetyltransferase [Geomonas sp. Red276]